MIITDSGREYNSEEMIVAIEKNKGDRTSIERDMLNEFNRLIYLRYVNIRRVVSDNRCQKMKVKEVKDRIETYQDKLTLYLQFSKEEIDFYIDYASKYIKMVS